MFCSSVRDLDVVALEEVVAEAVVVEALGFELAAEEPSVVVVLAALPPGPLLEMLLPVE